MEAINSLSGLLKPSIKLTAKEKLAINNNLGILYKILGQNDIALKYYDIAESVFLNNSFSDNSFLERIYSNKANIYSIKGDLNKALEYIEMAIRSVQENGDETLFKQKSTHSLFLNAGIIYFQLNNFEKALALFRISLSLKEKYNTIGKDNVYLNLARTYAKIGNISLADKYFNLSIKQSIIEGGNFSVNLVNIYTDYGYYLMFINENSKALSVFQKGLNINIENFGEKSLLTSNCYQFIGDYYWKIRDYQIALGYYQKALVSCSKEFNDLRIVANPSVADIPLNLWQLRVLRSKAKVLKILAETDQDNREKIRILLVSLSTINLAIEMTNSIRVEYQDEETRLIFNEKQKDIFVTAIETALQLFNLSGERQYLYLAYQTNQKYKANELKYEIARNKLFSNNDIPDSLRIKENSLQGDISSLGTLIRDESASQIPDTTKIAFWKNQQFDLKRALEKKSAEIERNYPRFIDKIKKGNIVAIKVVQSNLRSDESLIDYVISEKDENGSRKLYEFVITKENLVCNTEFIDSTLSEELFSFKEQSVNQFGGNINIEEYIKMNHRLFVAYNVLIRPIEKYFMGKQLIIIPDDVISYLPFDAFLTSMIEKKVINYAELAYLIRDYAISYSYSTSMIWNNQSKVTNRAKVIGFAPDYSNSSLFGGKEYRSLKSNSKEVESILKNFGGDVLKDDKATITNFKLYLNSGSILHLAMHAELDTLQAGSSSLIFTPDIKNKGNYQLYSHEIGQMNINSPLVVLSACNTGSGKLYNGEGFMSLARNFVLAGVPSIVETLWPVEDVAASKIMGNFFKYLSHGEDKNTALRKAKIDYINSTSPSFVNPRFWAAYTLMGDTSPIKNVWWKESWAIFTLILLISIIATLLIYWLRFLRIS